jgi:glycosyltransferase involved in cell wall biosynthesis
MGGGARNVRTFYKYMPESITMQVACFKERGAKYDEFAYICKDIFFAEGKVKNIVKYIKDRKINIIHLHGRGKLESWEDKLINEIRDEVKIVYTNIFGEYDESTDEKIDAMIFKSRHALTQKYALSADSNFVKKNNWYPRYAVIPNPIDVSYFESIRPSEIEIDRYRTQLSIASDEWVIGKVGARKALEKWSDLILNMFPTVLKKYPKTVMLLQGVPSSRLEWVREFGDRVRILPETNDDRQLALMYGLLDVFTHASKIGEQSGNSINEAMYWGKPVIVNLTPDRDNGQMEQIIDGVNGFYANTAKQYANQVIEILGDRLKREEFGLAAQNYVVEQNNPGILGRDLANVYQWLIDRASPNLSISLSDIQDYAKSYQDSLDHHMGRAGRNLSIGEKFSGIYWKIRDYIDYNWLNNK